MQLIDTHTHLYVEAFDQDRDEVISRAMRAGVTQFYLPAIDSAYTQRMLELEKRFPNHVRLMMGLHPTHVKDNVGEELEHVKQMLEIHRFYAVGEIGIDLYWDKTTCKAQQQAFDQQIQWAKAYKLPIVIHCREAFAEVFEILEGHRGDDLYGVFHCFTGTQKDALKAIELNLSLGIGGVATFKNGKIDQFLSQIPIEHLVLETDAPYLAPVPYRGKRNESAYITLVQEKLASLYSLSKEDVAKITSANAIKIFEK